MMSMHRCVVTDCIHLCLCACMHACVHACNSTISPCTLHRRVALPLAAGLPPLTRAPPPPPPPPSSDLSSSLMPQRSCGPGGGERGDEGFCYCTGGPIGSWQQRLGRFLAQAAPNVGGTGGGIDSNRERPGSAARVSEPARPAQVLLERGRGRAGAGVAHGAR